jgi:hypothetical protein
MAGHWPLAQDGSAAPPLWATGTLQRLLKCFFPHVGQAGFSSPRTSCSKSIPQSRHVYS